MSEMSDKSLRFVVQMHSTSGDVHWDFMLEYGNNLQTYRLDIDPSLIADEPVKAERIFDHRLEYLTYEGPISGGRGTVRISDRGTFTIIRQDQRRIELSLEGQVLKGEFRLEHAGGKQWHLARV
jgi:hypothetical protein